VNKGLGCGPEWRPSPQRKEPPNPGKMGVIPGVKPRQKSTGGPAKNTWNIGRNRLACGHGIGLETRRRVARKAQSANLKELGSGRLAPERLAAQSTRKANAGKRALKQAKAGYRKPHRSAYEIARFRPRRFRQSTTNGSARIWAVVARGTGVFVTLPASRPRAGL
jgi:hypothetical protein